MKHTSLHTTGGGYELRDNAGRADAAATALDAYTRDNLPGYANESAFDRIADLMCDLLHLAAREYTSGDDGLDTEAFEYETLLRRADANYTAERNDDDLGDLTACRAAQN